MTITVQPVDTVVQAGDNVTLTCDCDDASAKYQWFWEYPNGQIAALNGKTGKNLTFPTQFDQYRDYPYQYRAGHFCRVTAGGTYEDSDSAKVTAINTFG
jgi:hypothetical protein